MKALTCASPERTSDSRSITLQLTTWCLVAALGGVGSLVLPPYLTQDGLPRPAYGWPLLPWFALAWANVRVTVSMICYGTLGFAWVMAQPRRGWLLVFATVAVSPVLLAINILHDWTHDATSHNLFPFEFLMYAFTSFPVVAGALFGFLLRRLSHRLQPAWPGPSTGRG